MLSRFFDRCESSCKKKTLMRLCRFAFGYIRGDIGQTTSPAVRLPVEHPTIT